MKKLQTPALFLAIAWAAFATISWRTEAEEHAAGRKAADAIIKRFSSHVRLTADQPQPGVVAGK